MIHPRLFASALLLSASAALLADTQVARQISVPDFQTLVVMDGVDVTYHHADSTGTGTVNFIGGNPSTLSMVTVDEGKEKITVRLSDDGLNASGLPRLEVFSSKLTKVQNNGDSTVRVLSNPVVEKFSVRLEGNGTIEARGIQAREVNVSKFTGKGTVTVEGTCQKASIKNTGTGKVDCGSLETVDAKCNILGTGKIYCNVSGQLKLTGVSGTVYFTGHPTNIKNIALGVKLIPVEQMIAE